MSIKTVVVCDAQWVTMAYQWRVSRSSGRQHCVIAWELRRLTAMQCYIVNYNCDNDFRWRK